MVSVCREMIGIIPAFCKGRYTFDDIKHKTAGLLAPAVFVFKVFYYL